MSLGTCKAGLMLTLAIALCGTVQAHKLKVFAFADGARIEGSAYFTGGGSAAGARIRVEDGEGNLLAVLEPGGDGAFSYMAEGVFDHVVVADTGDGHRARWRIEAAELVAGFPHTADPGRVIDAASAGSTEASRDVPDGAKAEPDAGLQAAIERAVSRQIDPLREELIRTRDALRLADILGGIGYLFGIAGLAIWWHARRTRRP